ncbi:glutaminase A [Parvularcula sp. ZS-1/3]|uniref:Glutaminase n=1 Tax=Parvularcula mediterranea TaxID=2732508 RepID=A0A7Y3RP01_9PROT|nr:glutaminase A [Parvularcula mediterranea]NNU17611.1 glutaminase A [Parvularcula mediterranea]
MGADIVALHEQSQGPVIEKVFDALLPDGSDTILVEDVYAALAACGLDLQDRRIRETVRNLKRHAKGQKLDREGFREIVAPENASLIARGVAGDFIIPNFTSFQRRIGDIFEEVSKVESGQVANYIPQLASVDPDLFAVAVCTVDGQQFSLGDDHESFCVQSTCKPVSYAIALDALGRDAVHRHVGREPSGRGFNELTLNQNDLPHNPMINAGAIMTASLINPGRPLAERFSSVMDVWKRLSGGRRCGFDNAVFLSEKETADRNFALAYFMREHGAFPPGTDLLQTLDFYFQQCSITTDVRQMANLAATYANGGVCPTTSDHVFRAETVKDVLSLMYSCGMYDFSGEYAFSVGIPAKSGVSGALFMVVPGVCGIALYSPKLDVLGNSVRGVEFSRRLVETFAFHTYAGIVDDQDLVDPRRPRVERDAEAAAYLCSAAARGDIGEIRRLIASHIDPCTADYDGRTALHLAASEGEEKAVRYLLTICKDIRPLDRWGNSPLDDARREGHAGTEAILEEAYAAPAEDQG